ncbi:NAD-dependent epimerase/dehydratase family protein [Candidatus Micrarchaeota archaeon]|nr:NAD-dependent epimerase/dehydratase family protein [Candidatus Micrarchaeota archaeon]
MKVLVTGGCGFIGSHLVDNLLEKGHSVVVIDREETYRNGKTEYVKKDIVKDGIDGEFKGINTVFHLAADPYVKDSADVPERSFNDNVVGTFNVLEACRKNNVKRILFTSTSTVYGEAEVIPTPENYPCKPISNYGASKLADEAYVSSYAHTYGIKGTVLRLANIFGERSTHGVMYDFYNKLKKNSRELEILGDGKQEKSYLHVSDTVDAIMDVWKKQEKIYDVYNVGSSGKITVNELAEIMCREMEIEPEFRHTGGKVGWVGDVRLMLLECNKLKRLGWKEKVGLEEGIKKYIDWIL